MYIYNVYEKVTETVQKRNVKKEEKEKYLLVYLGCQDQSNERPEGSEIDETNCYGFCININNDNTYIHTYIYIKREREKMEYGLSI